MLTIALWVLAAAVAAGIALSCLYLLERPIRGWARLGAHAHGLLGAAGTVVVASLVVGGAADPQGFGRTALWMLGLTLLGGLIVLVSSLRHRRVPGLVVALHATIGMGAFVILLAYASIPH